jgi:hypothetical protein
MTDSILIKLVFIELWVTTSMIHGNSNIATEADIRYAHLVTKDHMQKGVK